MVGKENAREKIDRIWQILVLMSNPIMFEDNLGLLQRFVKEDGVETFETFCRGHQNSFEEILRENCRRAAIIFRNLIVEGTPFRAVVVDNLLDYLQKKALLPSDINLKTEELARLTSIEPDSPEREEWLLLLKTRLAMEEANEESCE
jgi:hypothetical protein